MAEYTAPLRDMQFVINELIGLSRVQQLAGFDEVSKDLSDAVLEEAAKLATEVLSPLNRVGDTVGCKLDGDVVHTPPGWREAEFRSSSTVLWRQARRALERTAM